MRLGGVGAIVAGAATFGRVEPGSRTPGSKISSIFSEGEPALPCRGLQADERAEEWLGESKSVYARLKDGREIVEIALVFVFFCREARSSSPSTVAADCVDFVRR